MRKNPEEGKRQMTELEHTQAVAHDVVTMLLPDADSHSHDVHAERVFAALRRSQNKANQSQFETVV